MGGTHSGAALGFVCVSAEPCCSPLPWEPAGLCSSNRGVKRENEGPWWELAPAWPSEPLAGWAIRVGGAGPGWPSCRRVATLCPSQSLPWACCGATRTCFSFALGYICRGAVGRNPSQDLSLVSPENTCRTLSEEHNLVKWPHGGQDVTTAGWAPE